MNNKSIFKLLVLSIGFFFNNLESIFAIAPEPNVQTFSFTATPGNCSEIDLNFIPGDGSKRIIIACPDVPVSKLPVDGVSYSAGSLFGSGTNMGSNNYVVYTSGGTSTTITGLDGGTEYYFAIFEFNGSGSNTNYLLPGYLEANTIAPGFTMSVSSSSGDMCNGDSVRLEVHGAETYTWSPSNHLSSATDSVVWATPNNTTQFEVIGFDSFGCSDSRQITITVYSVPNVTIGSFSNRCINDARVNLNSGSPNGGTYSGSGVSSHYFYPDVAGAGQHTITYTYSDIHGCSSDASSSILVLNKPNVQFSSLSDVCINEPAFVLTGGTPVGGIYGGSGVASGQFVPSVAGVGQHSLSYIYTDGSGCSDTDYTNERVRALPNVTFATLQPVCLNVPAFTITGGTPSGGTYSGTGVTNSQFSPLNTGPGTFLLTYSYTDQYGCSAQDTSNLKVNSLPTVTFSPLASVCQNTGPVHLSGGTPTGGAYSGTAVSSGNFYTGIAGAGQHSITYIYTNANNCSNSAVQTITVNPAPHPDLGPDIIVCSDEHAVLNAGTFSGYTWSTGAHTQSITVDTTHHGLGITPFTIIVANSFGCTGKDTIMVTFDQCTGINNLQMPKEGFFVYPNPSASNFTLVCDPGSELSIFDIKGTLIMENKNAPSVFSFGDDFIAGTYIVRVKNNLISQYKLILKN